MNTVVTGATGHLGNVLVRELLSRGESVRAIIPMPPRCGLRTCVVWLRR